MKILVGSKNPIKIESVKEAFIHFFSDIEVIGIEVNSYVPSQPIGEETFLGAKNRALYLKELNDKEKMNANFFVGIEGGIIKLFDRWFAFGCICIVDENGQMSFGTSPHFELPEFVIEKLLQGIELGDVIDEITNQRKSKQGIGAIGFFTKGVVSRKELYTQGVKVAIIPFLHKEMFFIK